MPTRSNGATLKEIIRWHSHFGHMTIYDHDYFFIRSDREANPRLPAMTPDANTAERQFRFEAEPSGSEPLVFINGWKDDFRQRGVKEDVADILFKGSNLLVRGHIRERLLPYAIPHLHMQLATYIDDSGGRHEDYWYLTWARKFDCWDRATSDYDDEPVESGSDALYSVYEYALNGQLLDETPLAARLLSKMGGTLQGMIVCHKSLADIFQGGARLQRVDDY